MTKAFFYSLLTLILSSSCCKYKVVYKPPVDQEQQLSSVEKEEISADQPQEREAKKVIPIPENAIDPIIDNYVRFVFGRDVNEPDKFGDTPLINAIHKKDEISVIMILLHPRLDLNAQDTCRDTILSVACIFGQDTVVKAISEKGYDVNEKSSYGNTALHWAALHGHSACVSLLLDKGANVYEKNRWGDTPLSWAENRGHHEIVKLLRKAGER